MQPRKPNEQEKQELIKFLTTEHEYIYDWEPYGLDESKQMVEDASIAVFDNHVGKDTYDYSGKVMIVVYGSGDLADSDIFAWRKSEANDNTLEMYLCRRDDD